MQGETRESRSEGIVDCGSGPAIKTQIRSKSRRGKRKRSKKSIIPVKQADGEMVEGSGISSTPPSLTAKVTEQYYASAGGDDVQLPNSCGSQRQPHNEERIFPVPPVQGIRAFEHEQCSVGERLCGESQDSSAIYSDTIISDASHPSIEHKVASSQVIQLVIKIVVLVLD